MSILLKENKFFKKIMRMDQHCCGIRNRCQNLL